MTCWRLAYVIVGTNKSIGDRIISTMVDCDLVSKEQSNSNNDERRALSRSIEAGVEVRSPSVIKITERGMKLLQKMENKMKLLSTIVCLLL